MYRQMETDKWRLVMNRNERRILVVEDILSPADKEDIKENDYEAVYIASCSGYDIDNVQTILSVHPLLEKKSGLKPIFVTDKLRGRLRMLAELIDGYADGPLAVSVINKIEKIYGNMQEMNFSCRTIQAETEEERLVHAFRLMVSRKKYRLVPLLSPGSSSGYVMPFIEVVERMGLVSATSRKRFRRSWWNWTTCGLSVSSIGYICVRSVSIHTSCSSRSVPSAGVQTSGVSRLSIISGVPMYLPKVPTRGMANWSVRSVTRHCGISG